MSPSRKAAREGELGWKNIPENKSNGEQLKGLESREGDCEKRWYEAFSA